MRSLINPKLQAALLRNSLSILISPRARIPKHFQAGLFGPNIRHTILLGDQTRRGGLKAWFEAASGVTVDRSVCNRCRVVAVAVVVFDLGAEAFDGCGGARSGLQTLCVTHVFFERRGGFGRGWVVVKGCDVK